MTAEMMKQKIDIRSRELEQMLREADYKVFHAVMKTSRTGQTQDVKFWIPQKEGTELFSIAKWVADILGLKYVEQHDCVGVWKHPDKHNVGKRLCMSLAEKLSVRIEQVRL